jgi:hypothetical protein
MSETEFPSERWRYIGRRPRAGTAGGVLTIWLDEQGAKQAFKARHRAVGALYEVPSVERDASGKVLRAGVDAARFVDGVEGVPRDEIARWELADRAAYGADEQRKAEARLKREQGGLGWLTLDEVRLYYAMAVGGQRAALLAAVIAYLEGGSA